MKLFFFMCDMRNSMNAVDNIIPKIVGPTHHRTCLHLANKMKVDFSNLSVCLL